MKRAFTIPIRTVSAANKREHPMTRHNRVKQERAAAWAWFPRRGERISVPAVVTLIRCAPLELDDDNLRAALKAIRDQIADELNVDDRDPRIGFKYGQQRGVAAVLVQIEFGPDVHVRATCPDPTSCSEHRQIEIDLPKNDPGQKLLGTFSAKPRSRRTSRS